MKVLKELVTFHFAPNRLDHGPTEFISALKLIIEGEDLKAAEILNHLYRDSIDLSLKSSCAKLLFDLYFSRSDWERIELLGLFDEPSIEKSNRLIGKACSQSEPIAFSFPNDQICMPMKLSLTSCPTIEVSINGKKKCLWLDTGAGMTVLSQTLAKDCNLHILKDRDIQVGNSTGKEMNTDLTFIDSLQMNDLSIQNQPSLVLADDLLKIQNPKTEEIMVIDGIIGWDVIQHIHLEIDYGKNQVIIQKPAYKEYVGANLFFCGYPIVKVKSEDNVSLYFGLDTGASKTHFGKPLLSKIDGLNIEKRTIHAGGIGEVKEVEIDSIENLIVCLREDQYIKLNNMRMVLEDFATFFKLDGVFGSDIAKGRRLIIDYANRKMELV